METYRYKEHIFSFLGDYYRVNDSYKDSEGRGFLQRYFEDVVAAEIDDQAWRRARNFMEDGIEFRTMEQRFIGVRENEIMIFEPLYFDINIRRKMLKYYPQLRRRHGLVKAYKFLYSQLGFTDTQVQEYFFNNGFDDIPFDDPLLNFDSSQQNWANFDLLLFSNPVITIDEDIFIQILRILEFNRPIHARLNQIKHNGLVIFSNSEVTTIFVFKTVKSGQQSVNTQMLIAQNLKIVYNDNSTEELAFGSNVTFLRTYPDSTEKEFELHYENATTVKLLNLLGAAISEVPDLSSLTNLYDFLIALSKQNETFTFELYTIINYTFNCLQTGNVIEVLSTEEAETITLTANDTALVVNNCPGMNSITVTGSPDEIDIQNTSRLTLDGKGVLELWIEGFALAALSDFMDSFTQLRTKSITLRGAIFQDMSVDFAGTSHLVNLDMEIDGQPGDEAFDLSGCPELETVRILSFDEQVDAQLSAGNNPELTSLELTRESTEKEYADFPLLTVLVIHQHNAVKINNLASLTKLSMRDCTLTSVNYHIATPLLNELDCIACYIGTRDDVLSEAKLFDYMHIPTLKIIRHIRCGLKRVEVDKIIDIIWTRQKYAGSFEIGNFDLPYWSFDSVRFPDATGKVLDLSNNTLLTTGGENESPSPVQVARAQELVDNYGWTIYLSDLEGGFSDGFSDGFV